MIMLEGAKATTETVDALRTGASAMKAMHKSTYVMLYELLPLNINYHP
jgi:charged multivesicular body protein 4A/B